MRVLQRFKTGLTLTRDSLAVLKKHPDLVLFPLISGIATLLFGAVLYLTVFAGGLAALEAVVVEFVHAMSRTDESTDLTADIEAVRAMESACDELRNTVISTAFDDDEIDQPLMYREFAILFDELANTMEDITDQVVIIASNEPGITTEPEPEQ